MKYVICILLFILRSVQGYGQIVAVQNENDKNLMVCIWNHLKIAVQGYNPSNIVLTTNNGNIKKCEYRHDKGCYTITPAKTGWATIYIQLKTGRKIKTIDSVRYKVLQWPPSHPRLDGKTGGIITKINLCMAIAPWAPVECCGFDAKFQIVGFTVIVQRRGREIFNRRTDGEIYVRIDSVTKEFFTRLRNRDKVTFREITVRDCDESLRIFESMEFVIIEAEKYRKPYKPKHGQEVIIDPITGIETIKKW